MSPTRRLVLKTAALTLLAAGCVGAAAGVVVLRSGWYDIGATAQHLPIVYALLEKGMHYSVRRHARAVKVPELGQTQQIQRGAAVYRDNCAQCHGGPGFAQSRIGMSMQPVPGPLVDASARWQPRELYWITRHGIKMSGMPAWEFHLSEDDTWAVVAFVKRLPALDAQDYRTLTAADGNNGPGGVPAPAAGLVGDPVRGKLALTQYACQACHMIPGATGSRVYVGRPLEGLAKRRFIAGTLPTSQANLARWIRNPQAVDPHTAMPAMGVSERDALDISAYLLGL
jgi:mono/diheme cytochrome c family protein